MLVTMRACKRFTLYGQVPLGWGADRQERKDTHVLGKSILRVLLWQTTGNSCTPELCLIQCVRVPQHLRECHTFPQSGCRGNRLCRLHTCHDIKGFWVPVYVQSVLHEYVGFHPCVLAHTCMTSELVFVQYIASRVHVEMWALGCINTIEKRGLVFLFMATLHPRKQAPRASPFPPTE